MGYHILHPSDTASPTTGGEVEPLRTQLVTGDPAAKRAALRRLIALDAQGTLAGCLAADDDQTVEFAIAGLWECWLNEAGPAARHRLEQGVELMHSNHLEAASNAFERLMAEFPDWAEAVNKQATVLFLQGELDRSIAQCHRVVAWKPDHFGAWNGMAICAIQGEDWPLALQAVRESLRLLPNSRSNHQLLRLVESRLRKA